MEPKHFHVGGFSGRLGAGLSADLVITDIPESSPCYAAGVPRGVRLTHIDGTRVGSHEDVKHKMSYLQAATAIVLSVVPVSEQQAEWWKGVKGNIEAAQGEEEEDDEDCYDPDQTTVRDVTQKEEEVGRSLPAYQGMQFKKPVDKGYDSEPSEYNSDIDSEEEQNWQPARKRFAHGGPYDPRPSNRGGHAPTPLQSNPVPHPTMGADPSHQAWMNQQNQQQQAQPQGRDTPDGLHPCARSGRRCNDFCNMRSYPSDACIHFLQKGGCTFHSGCRWLHCKQGLNIKGFAYQCETCQLSLARKADLQNHMKSRAHQMVSTRQVESQKKQAGLNTRAQSLLAQFKQSSGEEEEEQEEKKE